MTKASLTSLEENVRLALVASHGKSGLGHTEVTLPNWAQENVTSVAVMNVGTIVL